MACRTYLTTDSVSGPLLNGGWNGEVLFEFTSVRPMVSAFLLADQYDERLEIFLVVARDAVNKLAKRS